MDAAIPVVFRGAARELNLPRHRWSEPNIRQRFGQVNVSLGHIPYADQFDSAYNPKVKRVEPLETYIDTFAESGPMCHANKVCARPIVILTTVECHISAGEPGNTKVPEYLFSTDYYLKNPAMMHGFHDLFTMVRELHQLAMILLRHTI